MAVTVKASLGKTKYYTEVTAGENQLITDEPINKGGQNKGFNPFEILAASLASCTAATLRMYIDRKEWNVKKIDVEVELEYFPLTKLAVFKRTISFEGADLNDDQLKKLDTIANACPIHKILTNNIEIKTNFYNMTKVKQNNGDKHGSFEASIGGKKAGLMTYTWAGEERFIIDHTEVEEEFNGKGVGKEMLLAAVDFARKSNKKIIPLCPFVKATFQKNPDLQDVLI